ncbi:Helix-turn-helix motif protein [Thermogladius calderae 1633]|uniref:Helix-turn-helix motif protein n=2 Tax=Thermogladius calderae TaxID=1200300 RepID=I3TDL4_THEC1|nr:Helix-turn-helix motif protein [Thermogladius calderae 1633]
MVYMEMYLISILPLYTHRIFTGKKKIELRRFFGIRPSPGSLFVVYSSGSVRAIVGEFYAGEVFVGSPDEVAEIALRGETGVSKSDLRYIKGSRTAVGIEIRGARLYRRPVKLEELRTIFPGFQPPLSFRVLREDEPLYVLLIKKLRELS